LDLVEELEHERHELGLDPGVGDRLYDLMVTLLVNELGLDRRLMSLGMRRGNCEPLGGLQIDFFKFRLKTSIIKFRKINCIIFFIHFFLKTYLESLR